VKSYNQAKAFGKYFEQEREEYRNKKCLWPALEAMFIPLMMVLIGMSTSWLFCGWIASV
jgi:hypothetical protein